MAIALCGSADCRSDFQDKTYGKGMRVMNEVKMASRDVEGLRCTVCKREIARSRKTPLPEDKKGKKGKVDKGDDKVDKEPVKVDKAPAEKKKK